LLDLLVNNVQILERVSPQSLSDRAMSSRVDVILYIRRSTNVDEERLVLLVARLVVDGELLVSARAGSWARN